MGGALYYFAIDGGNMDLETAKRIAESLESIDRLLFYWFIVYCGYQLLQRFD